MIVTETENRINFIDKNDRFVGFSDDVQCCENFGWFVAKKIMSEGCEDNGIKNVDEAVEDFCFVPNGMTEYDDYQDPGGMLVFELVNAAGKKLYLHLYNYHNGYYSHGVYSNMMDVTRYL